MPKIKYRRPPLIERAVSIGYSIEEEPYQLKLDSWTAGIKKDFSEASVQNKWEIEVAEKNGMPYLPKDKQKITTKYQFWRSTGGEKDHCIQVWRDRVSFNLLRTNDHPRTYEDLRVFIHEWSAKWARHFEISSFRGATLEYVNIISTQTMPLFCKSREIPIGDILTTFRVPGPIQNLAPPYRFLFYLNHKQGELPVRLRVKLEDTPGEVALRLNFTASTEKPERDVGLDAMLKEVDVMHDVILGEFEAFFTEKAKDSFGPT